MTRGKKLSKTIEDSICFELIHSKLNQAVIAKKYDISPSFISEIKKRNNLSRRNRPAGRLNIDYNYFENINTPDKAYFLGFIAGDGYINIKRSCLTLSLNEKDLIILEEFKKLLNSEHKIVMRNCNNDHIKSAPSKMATISFSSKKICEDLIKAGVGPNKSKDLKMPLFLSDDLIQNYIRGIFDADGCWSINKKNQISFSFVSPSYIYIKEFQNYLVSVLNLSYTKIQSKTIKNRCFQIKYNGNKQCKKIYDYLYPNEGIKLHRKFEIPKNHYFNLSNKK